MDEACKDHQEPDTAERRPAGEPFRILVVEDNAADANLVREALNDAGALFVMTTVSDGIEALEFLHEQSNEECGDQPDLVLLDLNLPRMNGFEVLATMKADPDLKRIPVLILSSSTASADILHSYDLHANSYITKPTDLNEFFRIIRRLERFWLSTARLPQSARNSKANAT